MGRLAGDSRRLVKGRISRLQHRHQADARALPKWPRCGRSVPEIVGLERVPRAFPEPRDLKLQNLALEFGCHIVDSGANLGQRLGPGPQLRADMRVLLERREFACGFL